MCLFFKGSLFQISKHKISMIFLFSKYLNLYFFSPYPYFLPHYSFTPSLLVYFFWWHFSSFYPLSRSPKSFSFKFSFLFSLFDHVEMIHHPILYKTSFLNSLCLVATSKNLIIHGIVWKGVCSRWSLKWSPTFPFINFHFA